MNEIMDIQFYNHIKEILTSTRNRVYSAANFAMVEAYWNIGKSIVEQQGGEARAEYGAQLIKALSKQMTADFGKGFTISNLKYMRQFYLTFPNGHALRGELSWTHYRLFGGPSVLSGRMREIRMEYPTVGTADQQFLL